MAAVLQQQVNLDLLLAAEVALAYPVRAVTQFIIPAQQQRLAQRGQTAELLGQRLPLLRRRQI